MFEEAIEKPVYPEPGYPRGAEVPMKVPQSLTESMVSDLQTELEGIARLFCTLKDARLKGFLVDNDSIPVSSEPSEDIDYPEGSPLTQRIGEMILFSRSIRRDISRTIDRVV
jgi:hypothetical protein